MLSIAFFFLSKFFLTPNAHTQCLLTRKSIACHILCAYVRPPHSGGDTAHTDTAQSHSEYGRREDTSRQSKFMNVPSVHSVRFVRLCASLGQSLFFHICLQTIIKWCHVNIIIFCPSDYFALGVSIVW